MATVAQLEAALMKADAAGDDAAAREIAAAIKRARTAKPVKQRVAPPRTRGSGVAAVDALLDNINEIIFGVPEGAYNLAAMVTDPISGMIFGKEAVKQAQGQRRAATDYLSRKLITQPRPLARSLGQSIAPGAAVTRTANVLAPLAPKIPVIGDVVSKVLKSTASGGIGVKGASIPETIALKVAGGGTSGASTAALMGEDPVEGGLYGAGLPIVGTILKKLGGGAVDIFRMSKVQAGKIIREALGKDVKAAKAAFAQLSPGDQRLAQQVLVEAGVEPSPFFGLGQIVTSQIDPDTTARILAQQEAARTGRLAEAAGGSTMEDVRAAVRGGRAAVTEELAPLREEMYQRAGVASQVVPTKLSEAAELERLAAEQSGLNRRMTLGANRAETRIGETEDFYSRIGDEFRPEMVSEDRGIAGAMTQRGEKAGLTAIAARERAGDIYDEIDDLASQGMRPMRAADLIASLRRKMADPEILRGSVEEGAIKGVIRQLEKATDANGMLNPKALGKIRRSGINTIVNKLSVQMGGVPSRTGTPEAAQGTVLELRSLIDDTLRRGGGGDLVDEFLQKSERGYAAVNRGELAGEALRLYKEDPSGTQFRALVGGDLPKTVGKIMKGGPESEKFRPAFAGDPRRLMALEQSAGELETLNKMSQLGARGQTRAQNILSEQQPGKLSRAAMSIIRAKYPALAFAGTGTQGAASAFVTPGVQREIAKAYESGPNMMAAINERPTAVRMSEQVQQRLSPTARNIMAQQFGAPSTLGAQYNFPDIDPETGEPLVDIDFSEGYAVPIYGKTSRNSMRR